MIATTHHIIIHLKEMNRKRKLGRSPRCLWIAMKFMDLNNCDWMTFGKLLTSCSQSSVEDEFSILERSDTN